MNFASVGVVMSERESSAVRFLDGVSVPVPDPVPVRTPQTDRSRRRHRELRARRRERELRDLRDRVKPDSVDLHKVVRGYLRCHPRSEHRVDDVARDLDTFPASILNAISRLVSAGDPVELDGMEVRWVR